VCAHTGARPWPWCRVPCFGPALPVAASSALPGDTVGRLVRRRSWCERTTPRLAHRRGGGCWLSGGRGACRSVGAGRSRAVEGGLRRRLPGWRRDMRRLAPRGRGRDRRGIRRNRRGLGRRVRRYRPRQGGAGRKKHSQCGGRQGEPEAAGEAVVSGRSTPRPHLRSPPACTATATRERCSPRWAERSAPTHSASAPPSATGVAATRSSRDLAIRPAPTRRKRARSPHRRALWQRAGRTARPPRGRAPRDTCRPGRLPDPGERRAR
jgi:hypothetical protein